MQVGYGLEEKVTDALAGDIIRSNMIPAFKQQKLAKGLELAINALNNQLTSQHQYPTNPSESESASSSDHYYFAIFWVFAVMFFPFWFFHQGSNFCRACKSGVCISAIYLLDLFLFSDKIFSIAVFSFFFTFTIFMVFTCLCVLQKRASGRSYHSDNSGSAGGSDSGGFRGGGESQSYAWPLISLRPLYGAFSPRASSIRISWLYLATRSERLIEPVLIWPAAVPTARSAMVASSVSPER